MQVPFCRDCKFKERDISSLSFCKRPTGSINPVTGCIHIVDRSCNLERLIGNCGPTGRYFVQNEHIIYKIRKFINLV